MTEAEWPWRLGVAVDVAAKSSNSPRPRTIVTKAHITMSYATIMKQHVLSFSQDFSLSSSSTLVFSRDSDNDLMETWGKEKRRKKSRKNANPIRSFAKRLKISVNEYRYFKIPQHKHWILFIFFVVFSKASTSSCWFAIVLVQNWFKNRTNFGTKKKIEIVRLLLDVNRAGFHQLIVNAFDSVNTAIRDSRAYSMQTERTYFYCATGMRNRTSVLRKKWRNEHTRSYGQTGFQCRSDDWRGARMDDWELRVRLW